MEIFAVKKFFRIAAPVLVLVAGFLVMQGLVAAKPVPEKTDDAVRAVSLYVDSVTSEEVKVAIRTQGEVRPKTEIELIPQVSGRIVAMSDNFNEGAQFAPNSMLLKIDDADYRVALVQAGRGRRRQARRRGLGIGQSLALLLDHAASVNTADSRGVTALLIAASQGNVEIVDVTVPTVRFPEASEEAGPQTTAGKVWWMIWKRRRCSSM